MRGWQASSHRVSPRSEPLAAAGGERPRYQSIADNACAACHKSHGAPERERLLNDHPSQLCTDCHDGTTARNILSAMNQRSGHRFNAFGHQRRDPTDRLRITQAVECTDCHNPHAAGPDVLVGGRGPGWPDPTVPPAMREVPGVTAGGVEVPRARLYYEVCFRCHADNPVRVRDRIQRESDSGGNIRRELLPTAASAHPIVFAARNTADVPSLLPTLRQRRYIGCQDCHDNPDGRSAGGAEAAGPHGSRFDHLLVARYETADQTLESPQTYALCYQCHDRTSILANESFTLHRNHVVRDRTPCSACHAPHGVSGSGSEHDHLINFDLAIVSGRRFYQDTGRFSGTCTLRCHGVEHVNFIYGNP
jgi:predicted CXXCH cytochrome family protein